jgi:hypothetical protein
LMYANRACNHVAHTLAKQVSDGNRTGEWLFAPSSIANLLTEDCNHDPLWLIQAASHKKKEIKYIGKTMKIKKYMDQPDHTAVEHANMENNM